MSAATNLTVVTGTYMPIPASLALPTFGHMPGVALFAVMAFADVSAVADIA